MWASVVSFLLAGTPAPGVALTWAAPVGCPTQSQVEAAIGRLVQDTGKDQPVAVEALISGRETSWQIELTGAGGRRTLSGTSCRAVSEAAVVVIALMVDPLASTDAPPLLDEAQRPLTFSVGLWGLVDTHALPKPSPGTGLVASLGVGAGFFLEFHGQAFLRQVSASDGRPGASVFLVSGGLGARRDFDFGPFALAPLLAVEAGALRAVSFGVTNPSGSVVPWVAGRGGVMLALTFGVFRVGVRGEAVVPFTRPRFLVDSVGVLHTPAPVSFRGALTLELTFPPRVVDGGGN